MGTEPVPTVVLCGAHPSQRRTPIACTTVQHGHTGAEHTVYEFLWKAAGKWGRRESDDTRLLRFKQPWLASMVGMHENSIRSILKNLRKKLAIDETGKAGPAQGREVRIYSYGALLDRRRKHGLVWAIRSHGVNLFTSEQVREMVDPGIPVGTDIVGTESLEDLVENEAVGTESLRENLPETPGLSLQNRYPSKEINISTVQPIRTSSSAAHPAVVAALRLTVGDADDLLAMRITEACRRMCPDAAPEEIAYFIEQKGRHRNIRSSLAGFLIHVVPRCFEGESFRQFREAAEARRQAEAAEEAKNREICRGLLEEARMVLANPAAYPERDVAAAEGTVRWVAENYPELNGKGK